MTELTPESAIEFVKKNAKLIVQNFASQEDYPSSDNPFTIYMAGSPGAGKTEFSKSFIVNYRAKYPEEKIVRIDADEIREMIPGYKGNESHIVQRAASVGVEKLFDQVQDKKQNAIVDGTFAHFDVSLKNINRDLKKGRKVGIFHIYQEPLVAWDFTRKRAELGGRSIPCDAFVEEFFTAQENVKRMKAQFGPKIELTLVIKNVANGVEKSHFNIDTIDGYIKNEYTADSLKDKLC